MLKGNSDDGSIIRFSTDEKTIVSGSEDDIVRFWRVL